MTYTEHFWSHMMISAHFLSHATNTSTIIRFVFIGMTLVDTFGLVGGVKRLRLPHLDGYLSVSDDLFPFACLHLILHPVINPPTQKLYLSRKGLLYVN